MIKKIGFSILLFLFVFSCNYKQNEAPKNTFAPEVIEANSLLIPADSISKSEIQLSGKPLVIAEGKPTIVSPITNVNMAGKPSVVLCGIPIVSTPGKGTFSLPIRVPAINNPILAGTSEVIIAKDTYVKDKNSQSLFSYGVLQGLMNNDVNCMLQDKVGDLWLGTNEGVSKFDGKYFTNYTTKEGLCNNTITSMVEDKKGNIWIGTKDGVSKYDGKYFTNYTTKEGLSNNTISSIIEDKKGMIWFGTKGGISIYDGNFFTIYTTKEGLGNDFISSMLQDKYGNLWIGTMQGVSKYDGNSFTNFSGNEDLFFKVTSMIEDNVGNIWFATGFGVLKYDGKYLSHYTGVEGLSNINENDGMRNDIVFSMLQDKRGNIWFGTVGGISKYNGKSFTNISEEEGLNKDFIKSIIEDKSGNLWFGAFEGGLSKYNGKTFTHFTDKEGLGNDISGILEDNIGNLWFAEYNGGAKKYDGKSFSYYTSKEGLCDNVLSMLKDKKGNLWFTSFDGVTKYDGKFFTHYTEKEGLGNNTVWSIAEDKIGNIWFGTNLGLSQFDGKKFSQFGIKQGLIDNSVHKMLIDKSGNLWFMIYGGGLFKYDGKTFVRFTKKEGLCGNSVLSMLEDKNGTLWFGTDGGVSKFEGKEIINYTDKEGLSNNLVESIIQDKEGNIFFGTKSGLTKLSSAEIKRSLLNPIRIPIFKNYEYEDGFLGISCYENSICEDKNGTVWLGTIDRVTAFRPKEDVDTIPPNIQLTGISLFNEKIPWLSLEHKKDTCLVLGNGVTVWDFHFDSTSRWHSIPVDLSLAYNNNNITFNFLGIATKSSNKVKYKYMLDGLDENWSALTSLVEAPYGNLSQGTYTFKVKAMNSEGYWSNEFNYTFTIRPPWWKTWWFRTFTVLLIIGSIIGYFQYRTASLRKRQKELEQTVEERTSEVIAQKEELVQKNIVVEKQKEEVVKQKQLVEEKNKEITDSIEYALRIQTAILPPQKVVKQYLENSFVLYKPKDIVAGDFYWMETTDDLVLFAACDCTGHGVPGAMVSVVCHNALNRAVREFGLTQPAAILDKTAEIVIENFSKSEEDIKDGMDISLCVFNIKTKKLDWAGANNPLWLFQNGELIETKADKQPIGMYEDNHPFTNHEFSLNSNDAIYIFSDGFADQFGGDAGEKKLTRKKFKELLFTIQNIPMQEQGKALEKFIVDYRKNIEQIDDILVIGVRV